MAEIDIGSKMGKWRWLIVVAVVGLIFGGGFLGGYTYCVMGCHIGQETPITVDDGLAYLREMRYGHQYYVDHPNEILPEYAFGDLKWQEHCVKEYDQLIDLVGRLNR